MFKAFRQFAAVAVLQQSNRLSRHTKRGQTKNGHLRTGGAGWASALSGSGRRQQTRAAALHGCLHRRCRPWWLGRRSCTLALAPASARW